MRGARSEHAELSTQYPVCSIMRISGLAQGWHAGRHAHLPCAEGGYFLCAVCGHALCAACTCAIQKAVENAGLVIEHTSAPPSLALSPKNGGAS